MQIANTTRARYARGTHERDSGKHVGLQLHHSPVMHVTITRVEHIFLETYLLSWSCNKKFYGCNWLVYQRLNVTDMCHWNVIDLRKQKMAKSRDDQELYSWKLTKVQGVFACLPSYTKKAFETHHADA